MNCAQGSSSSSSGTPAPEPSTVTATVSGSVALTSGFSGFSGTAAEDGTSFSVTLPNGMDGSITATLSSTDVSFSGKVTGQAEAFEDAEFSITGTIAIQTTNAEYTVEGTFSGTYDAADGNPTLTVSSITGEAAVSVYSVNQSNITPTNEDSNWSSVTAITLTCPDAPELVFTKSSGNINVTGTVSAESLGKTLDLEEDGITGAKFTSGTVKLPSSGTGSAITTGIEITLVLEAED